MTDQPLALRLLLVGGGHATVALLKRAGAWVEAGVDVCLLSDHPTLYYSGMVPEYLGGLYPPEDVQVDLVGWCERTGVRWVQGRATAIDPETRTIQTAEGDHLTCDVAVFDIGSRNPGSPPRRETIMTKPLHSIERLRAFLEALPEEPPEPARLVIVGGGAAGVEMALNVSARFLAQGRPRDLHLSLVEASGCLLSMFPRGMGEYASELLRDRGVALHLSAQVERITEAMLLLDDGTALPHDAVLWATGATGQRLFAEAGLACDQRNFLRVNQALQCPDYPWLFAAGDCAVVEGMETLARVGVHAVKQGPVLHTNLSRVLAGLQTGRPLDAVSLEDFKPYPLAPLILSTGADEALMVAGRLWLRGTWMLRLKHRADLAWIKNYWLHRSQELSWRELFNARSVLDSPGPILGL